MKMTDSIHRLRACAVNDTLFPATTLPAALKRLGFVQADPIKSPATAQDLILRQRVKNYRAGDLERRYASLDIEEDYLYAYGFMPRDNWRLLHPRDTHDLSPLEKKVLKVLRAHPEMHPRDLEEHFGAERVVNAWGGYSKATTHVLDALHHRGLLRICKREKGIRVYRAAEAIVQTMSEAERSRALVLILANIFAPVMEKNLRKLRFSRPDSCNTRAIITELLEEGLLEREEVDGIAYLRPASLKKTETAPPVVRFLAPFDPLVWDRERFEKLWGWEYRFEAYTPVAKRICGYYALPLLWGDDIIGWVNASKGEVDSRGQRKLDLEIGYVGKKPSGAAYKAALAEEVERFNSFLQTGKA